MASLSFVLKEPKSTKETLVYFLFRYSNERVKCTTKEKILPEFWHPVKQRAKETRKFSEYPEFNARLDDIASKARTFYRQFLNDNGREPSTVELKAVFDHGMLEKPAEPKPDLFGFIEKFIAESRNKVNPGTGKPLSKGILNVYTHTLVLLREYAKLNRKPLDFDKIDLDFYHGFTDYLIHTKRYSNNTVGKHVKTVKTFLNDATERGLNTSMAYKSKRFKVTREDTESIYLNETELGELSALDLSEQPVLDNARDLFIIGCWTGLRFSDFSRLTLSHVKGEFIDIVTLKTGEAVMIPLHASVKAIIAKYRDKSASALPHSISNVKLNLYLKRIGELIPSMHQAVSFSTTKAGLRITTTRLKYELLTTHTARRSFATNLYIAGVPAYIIMKITGHRTEKAFLRYIKITPAENAKYLQVFWQKKTDLNVIAS